VKVKRKVKKVTENEWTKRLDVLEKRLGSREAVAAALEVGMSAIYYWRHGRVPSRLAQLRIFEVERQSKVSK
jgi:hypothetical protein